MTKRCVAVLLAALAIAVVVPAAGDIITVEAMPADSIPNQEDRDGHDRVVCDI